MGLKQQKRTSHCGDVQYQWVSDPEPETWRAWTNTGRTRGSLANREREQRRTSNYGNAQTRWVADPEPPPPPPPPPVWTDTGSFRGCGATRQKAQRRGSATRWVAAAESLRWGPWVDTGVTSGHLGVGLKQQKRTSHCGDIQYQWVSL